MSNLETPVNYSQKTICCMVLDASGSMAGSSIDQLNQGVKTFINEISSDEATANRLEIAVIKFNDTVEILQPACLVDNVNIPIIDASGTTKMVDGIEAAINLVQDRKLYYKTTGQPYNRPWIVLLTDGEPDSGQDINGISAKIKNGMTNNDFMFLPIGVSGANMNILDSICGSVKGVNGIEKVSPMGLENAKFSDFFKWLSASMKIASQDVDSGSNITTTLPVPAWMTGYKI